MTNFEHTTRMRQTGVWVITSLVMTASLLFWQQDRELYDPVALFLTWQQDPTTTITIDWHTVPEDGERETVIQYKKDGNNLWGETFGTSHAFPHSDRTIHRVQITNLEPGTTYHFRFGEHSKVYKFVTMPADLSKPLRFAAGGDTGHDENFRKMNRVVMSYNPDFIIWGGDLSYANGDPALINRWYGWFDGIKESLIDEEGRVIPIILAIGNHELFGVHRLSNDTDVNAYLEEFNLWDGKATFFFDLFAFPGRPSYNVLDFGDYLSLIALDSDHYSEVEGPQAEWLEGVLAERADRLHVFPFYHVPAYPSHRSYSGATSIRIRDHWVPLFEQYNVRVSFENHDHTYKRTHPIRGGEIVSDQEGVVYIGDGAWVRGPRPGDRKNEWYINHFASLNHGIVATLQEDTHYYVMVDSDGVLFDYYDPGGSMPMDEFIFRKPERITLVHPSTAQTNVELQPVFYWEADQVAQAYQFQLSKDFFTVDNPSLLRDTTLTATELQLSYELDDNEIYYWRVRGINNQGEGPWAFTREFTTGDGAATSAFADGTLPAYFMLDHNYPNPFNPATTIRYGLPVNAYVELRVFDLIGREVALLVNQDLPAGYHQVTFNSGNLSSGVYTYRIKVTPSGAHSASDSFVQTRIMSVIK